MSKRRNLTALITAKGCPQACTFCHIHHTPYSDRSPTATVDEMEQCVTRYSVREFEIFDPSFTCRKKRVMAICDEILARGLDLDFAVRARVDQVDGPLLEKMAAAGCKRILYGIESGSQAQMDRVQKGISLDQVRTSVRLTRQAGIKALGFFLVGTPGETKQDIDRTVAFALELGLDYAQFHRTMAKPRTQLNDLVTKHLGYDYWREFTLGRQPEIRLPSPWTDQSQEEIEQAAYDAYRKFYMRPSYLVRTVLGIRSFREFARYVRSGIGLLRGTSDLR